MCGLRIFAGPPIYHLWEASYLLLLALSILTYRLNMSFLARLFSDNSRSLEKYELGHCPPQPTLTKKVCNRVWVLVLSYICVKFDLTSSINFTYINGFPKLGARTFIMGHRIRSVVLPLNSTGLISYWSLIVHEAVSCTVSELAFDTSTSLYWLTLLRLTPTEGFPRWRSP